MRPRDFRMGVNSVSQRWVCLQCRGFPTSPTVKYSVSFTNKYQHKWHRNTCCHRKMGIRTIFTVSPLCLESSLHSFGLDDLLIVRKFASVSGPVDPGVPTTNSNVTYFVCSQVFYFLLSRFIQLHFPNPLPAQSDVARTVNQTLIRGLMIGRLVLGF